MVELERDEGGQPAEGALAHLGQVVVAEVEVLELGHVDEGAVDVDDGVVGDVQRGELAQRVEGVPRLERGGGQFDTQQVGLRHGSKFTLVSAPRYS